MLLTEAVVAITINHTTFIWELDTMTTAQGGSACAEPESSGINLTMLLASRPGLRQALGGQTYKAVLELGCGDLGVYRILAHSSKYLYIGLGKDDTLIGRLSEHYARYQSGDNLVRSAFFKRDVLSLEEKGTHFDLVCVNSLSQQARTTEGLRRNVFKMLHHGRKVILHVVLSEEIGSHDDVCLSECLPPLFAGSQTYKFFSLLTYQGIAQQCGRKMYQIRGDIVELFGHRYETTYLVYE